MAKLRWMQAPAPVKVAGMDLTIADFVKFCVRRDPRFSRTGAGVRQGLRIEAAFDRDPVVLDAEDYDALLDAAENPPPMKGPDGEEVSGYHLPLGNGRAVFVGRDVIPFLDAIAGAASEQPEQGPTTEETADTAARPETEH